MESDFANLDITIFVITCYAATHFAVEALAWTGEDTTSGTNHLKEKNSMRRAVWTVVALTAFAYTLLPGISAFAGYGAIAWDQETGKYGASWNEPTGKAAEEKARSECGATGCKIVARVRPGMCGALATTKDGKQAGTAWRKNGDAARLDALKSCANNKAGECIVRTTDCNK